MAKLFQGADSTLVQSAAMAGRAEQLPDYSQTFQHVAKGYHQSMMANAGMWASIGAAGMQVASAIDKSIRLDAQKSQAIEDLFGTDGAKDVFAKLEGYKDEMKRLTGIFKDDREFIDDPDNPGTQIKNPNYEKRLNPFSKETRDNRKALRKKMNDYYAGLDKIGVDTEALVTGWANKLVDEKQTSLLSSEWSNAIIQSRNGKSTDYGNRVVLEEDENGDWAYVMYHDKDKIKEGAKQIVGVPGFTMKGASLDTDGRVLGTDGKPVRYTAAQLNDMLILKDEDKNGVSAMQKGLEGFFDGLYTNSTGRDLLPHQKNQLSIFLDKIKANPKAWMTQNKWGEDGKSWFEEMNSISVESGKAYGQISNLMGDIDSLLTQDQKTKLLGGITDIGNKGIDIDDFVGKTNQHSENYRALTLALFNPGSGSYDANVTGELFKEAMESKVGAVRTSGWNASPNNPLNKKGTTDEITDLKSFLGYKKNLYTKYGTYHPPMAFYNASLEINNRLDGSIGDTWFESGLSNNRYKYEDQEWYRQIPDNSKNGWSKKQKMTLDQVKSDLSLMDYNYILFPEIDLSGMKGGNN